MKICDSPSYIPNGKVLKVFDQELPINFCPFCGRAIDNNAFKVFTIDELKCIVVPICRKYNVKKQLYLVRMLKELLYLKVMLILYLIQI